MGSRGIYAAVRGWGRRCLSISTTQISFFNNIGYIIILSRPLLAVFLHCTGTDNSQGLLFSFDTTGTYWVHTQVRLRLDARHRYAHRRDGEGAFRALLRVDAVEERKRGQYTHTQSNL